MKTPHLVVSLFLVAGLAACSSNTAGKVNPPAATSTAPSSSTASSSSPSASASSTPTGTSAFCVQLQTALTNVSSLASKANDLSAYKSTIVAYANAFNGLASQAPASIKGALSDMATALNTLSNALNGGGLSGLSSLSSMAPRLATDGQQIGQYVTANCAGA